MCAPGASPIRNMPSTVRPFTTVNVLPFSAVSMTCTLLPPAIVTLSKVKLPICVKPAAESSIVPSMISAMGATLPGARPKFHGPVTSSSFRLPVTWPIRLTVPPDLVNVPILAWVKLPPRFSVPPIKSIVPVFVQ